MQEEYMINIKHCRNMVLRIARDRRTGWAPKRVSKEYLDKLDAKVRAIIIKSVMSHRSVGKTIKDLI
ncbi:MAG TPA: hypothetical protein VMW72_04290 [Sedimentisphaerales bacterium]|nr:hypothetical protein [Sedimentisphaerales bacterium]